MSDRSIEKRVLWLEAEIKRTRRAVGWILMVIGIEVIIELLCSIWKLLN